jgi:hypothetical protein
VRRQWKCCGATFFLDAGQKLTIFGSFDSGAMNALTKNQEPIMAETPNVVAQNVSQMQQMTSEWAKLVAAQVAGVEMVIGELARLESRSTAQALTAWEEAGRQAKEGLALAEKASSEWRKLVLESARRTAQFLTPKV